MNYDWPKILAMTGVFLGPVLAVASVIGRLCTRKYRLLLNLLFVPTLCVPVALIMLGPRLVPAVGYDRHMTPEANPGSRPLVEGERHLGRQIIVWTALGILYWLIILEVMIFEIYHVLYTAEGRGEARRSLFWIVGLGSLSTGLTIGWIMLSNAVADSDSGPVAIFFSSKSWIAIYVNAALYLACWIGLVSVLVLPVVKLQDLMYRDARYGAGTTATFRETEALLGNEHWEYYLAVPRE